MLTATAKPSIEPIPSGMHRARCVSVIDLGTQPPSQPKYRPAHKILIEWELPDETFDVDDNGTTKQVPRRISRPFGLTLGKKSTLKAVLESWRGRPFTKEELEGFDIAKLLGVPCYLNIIHNAIPSGETYANISSITPLPKKLQDDLPPQYHRSIRYDLEQGQDEVFQKLPEWIRGKILQCEEWNLNGDSQPASENGGPDGLVDDDTGSVPF